MLRIWVVAAMLCFSVSAAAVEYLVVTADGVRVRAEPNLSGRSLTMLHSGHLVVKVAESGDWTKIYFLGKEKASGKTQGWMHSRFLEAEKGPQDNAALEDESAETKPNEPKALSLIDGLADLDCEKGADSGFVQTCDLHLRYRLSESRNLKNIQVSCDAQLLAKSNSGDDIPVPVNQTLQHQVLFGQRDFSMHIIMKADASYELKDVDLQQHQCQLVSHVDS